MGYYVRRLFQQSEEKPMLERTSIKSIFNIVLKMDKNFDTERFISELEFRPSLWDTTSADYSSKVKKSQCWNELLGMFLEDKDMTDVQKLAFRKWLQHRWKNLRSCYCRELHRKVKKKSGSKANQNMPYIYFNQLSFLEKVTKCHKTRGRPRRTDEEESEEEPSPQVETFPTKMKKRKKSKTYIEKQLFQSLQESIKEREKRGKFAEDDEDRLFLLSLLKPLKKVPDKLRSSVRMEILKVIQRAQSAGSSSTTLQFKISPSHQEFHQESRQQQHSHSTKDLCNISSTPRGSEIILRKKPTEYHDMDDTSEEENSAIIAIPSSASSNSSLSAEDIKAEVDFSY